MAELAQVQDIVHQVIDPITQIPLGDTKPKISVNNNTVSVGLSYPVNGYIEQLKAAISLALSMHGIVDVELDLQIQIIKHKAQQGVPLLDKVKNIIAVASGKGGVGKSTTSVNIALALSADGARVGLLDADIYGPSQTRMMGISGRPESKDGQSIEPMENYGVQAMSMGMLVDEEDAMIWRGPMVTQALQQMLNDTNWDNLDYLVIDLPPGTGDIQLTLSQKVPVSGAVIVTTPQDISLLDARKAYKMFEKVNVPVLGVIENMSTHICSQCGHEEAIFGSGGGQTMAEQYGLDLLGSLPLDIRIRENADGGEPTVVSDPDSDLAERYLSIARNISVRLAMQAKDYSSAFPNIVVKND